MDKPSNQSPTPAPEPTLKDLILSQTDLPIEPVRAFGRDLRVRTMSGTERDRFEQAFLDAKEQNKAPNIRGLIVALCVVDAKGQRVFTDKDAGRLGTLSAKQLDKVFAVAARLNGIGKDDLAELEGNSAGAGGDGSS